tara:strand:- start:325 stop:492 length:168 start_codon:yes stop_codon:yes gene_type:complete
MYHMLLTTEELEYLHKLITEKIDTYGGDDSKVIESIKRKLDDPENADGYYDAVDY